MECWDMLEDILVGRKAEAGGRGGQGLAGGVGSQPSAPPALCTPDLCRGCSGLLFPVLPTRGRTWHRLSQGSSSVANTNMCSQLVFCSEKGHVQGGGRNSQSWYLPGYGQAVLASHHSPSLLSIRQDHGSQPPGLSGVVAVTGGQQRDVTGQGWDTESHCWRQECLAVVLDGISQVFADPLGWL